MFSKQKQKVALSALAMAGGVLFGPLARADSSTAEGFHYTLSLWNEAVGNTNIGEAHFYMGEEMAWWNPKGVSPAIRSNDTFSQSWQSLDDYVTLFGLEFHPLSVFAQGRADMVGSDGSFSFTKSTDAHFRVLNSDVGSVSKAACDWRAECATQNASISQTFFSVDVPFSVSIATITLHVDVDGSLFENVTGKAASVALLDRPALGDLIGQTSTSMSAGASLTAHLGVDGSVISSVLDSVGVTSAIKLIEVSIGPSNGNSLVATPNKSSVAWSNTVPLTVSTLNGSVDVNAHVLWVGSVTENVVSWNGYSTTTNLFNESGSQIFN
ncbi:MAG TPA: hypothetical protein VNO55_10190 [Polyangia bacterium]|nr:hypothetical protein [Polyangia bacterium]